MDTSKNFFQLLGDWLAAWQARRRETAVQSRPPRRLTTWLPTRGNVIFTLLMIVLLVLAQSVGALPLPIPQSAIHNSQSTIAYQGRLADSAGAPLTGTYNMIFRLYDVATGGMPLWEEQWTGSNGVKVSDGLFNVMLGSLSPISSSLVTSHSSLFLGITVGTDDEMAPRVQLGSVPFAVQALTVPDGSVTTAKIADGAVTQAKLGADVSLTPPDGSITTAKIADGAVTAAKLAVFPQMVDCFPPLSQFGFSQATSGNWSNDLFSCTFTVATTGILYMSLQGHQSTSEGGWCSFSIFFDGVNINTGPRDHPSLTYITTWHPSFMADTVSVAAGTHTISVRMKGSSSNVCSLHDPDINGLFVPTQ